MIKTARYFMIWRRREWRRRRSSGCASNSDAGASKAFSEAAPARRSRSPTSRRSKSRIKNSRKKSPGRVALEKRLRQLAEHDPMTGLLNRRAFFNKAQEQVERADRDNAQFCLLMFDIDELNEVNDHFRTFRSVIV